MDAAISAKLQRSLLRVSETTNADVPPMLQQACTDIALALSDAISNYQIYKTYRGNSLKALEELSSFIAKKKKCLCDSIPSYEVQPRSTTTSIDLAD